MINRRTLRVKVLQLLYSYSHQYTQSDDIDNVFQITIYGKTLENQNIVCHVTDFKPSFYVKIPEKWTKNKFESCIVNTINFKLKIWERKFINVEVKPPKYHYDF